jgi:serine/threonine protein kinase
MLTGEHLFEGESAIEVALHHINTAPPPLPAALSAYQPLMERLLEKDRDARFRSTDEVIGYLYRKFAQGTRPS